MLTVKFETVLNLAPPRAVSQPLQLRISSEFNKIFLSWQITFHVLSNGIFLTSHRSPKDCIRCELAKTSTNFAAAKWRPKKTKQVTRHVIDDAVSSTFFPPGMTQMYFCDHNSCQMDYVKNNIEWKLASDLPWPFHAVHGENLPTAIKIEWSSI